MARGQATAVETEWRRFEPLELTPLLSAALDAFYEHGFHGTTVRDIVRRVGQTLPSLYYHHESKEGAFVALLELSTGELAWRLNAAATDADNPEGQFVNVIESIVLHVAHRTRLAALDLELRHLSPDSRKRYAGRRKEIENLLRGIVEYAVATGDFVVGVPAETTRALLGMCQSIARWYQPDGALGPRELADRYVDIALSTVAARSRDQVMAGRQDASRR